MRSAEVAFGKITAAEEPTETSYIGPGFLGNPHAEALRRLGEYKAAREFARLAVETPGHQRGKANRLFTLSRVLMTEGEIEGAALAADEMLTLAHSTESRRLHDRLASLARSMHPHRTVNSVRDFLEKTEMLSRLSTAPGVGGPMTQDVGVDSRWKIHSETVVQANQWFSLNMTDVELPSGTHLDHWVLRQPPVVVTAMVNQAGEVLLLWRHRFITNTWGYELPGGVLSGRIHFRRRSARSRRRNRMATQNPQTADATAISQRAI